MGYSLDEYRNDFISSCREHMATYLTNVKLAVEGFRPGGSDSANAFFWINAGLSLATTLLNAHPLTSLTVGFTSSLIQQGVDDHLKKKHSNAGDAFRQLISSSLEKTIDQHLTGTSSQWYQTVDAGGRKNFASYQTTGAPLPTNAVAAWVKDGTLPSHQGVRAKTRQMLSEMWTYFMKDLDDYDEDVIGMRGSYDSRTPVGVFGEIDELHYIMQTKEFWRREAREIVKAITHHKKLVRRSNLAQRTAVLNLLDRAESHVKRNIIEDRWERERRRPRGVCFAPGTPVETVDGPVAIETVRVGMWLPTYDEASGEVVPRQVQELISGRRNDLVAVHIPGTHLRCSPNHRFLTAGRGWVEAEDLLDGDLLNGLGRPQVPVLGVEAPSDAAEVTVHNLELHEHHNYFVSELPVLCHNAKIR